MIDEYARRKAKRQAAAIAWRPGQPLPHISYTPEEDALWETVSTKLHALHADAACAHYRRAARSVVLTEKRVPQLAEVSAVLTSLTGFRLRPAAGTVPGRRFLGACAENYFFATQYLRRPELPYHSPEPDVIHELIGHAVLLGDPVFADLYRSFGEAARRVASPEGLQALSQVFWFTMEVGVVIEQAQPRAYGAALLSSVAEMESLPGVELRKYDVDEILGQELDDTRCMPVLFAVESIDHLAGELHRFLAGL